MALRWEARNTDEKADKLRDELDELLRHVNPKRFKEIEKRQQDIETQISQLSAMVATLIEKLKKAEEA